MIRLRLLLVKSLWSAFILSSIGVNAWAETDPVGPSQQPIDLAVVSPSTTGESSEDQATDSVQQGAQDLAAARSEQETRQVTTIRAIRIEGNQRVEPSTILTYLNVDLGSSYDSVAISQAVRRLYETGLFADVSTSMRGDELVVSVVENPVINQVNFEGNKRVDDDELLNEIKLTPRAVYTKPKLQADLRRIQEVYRQNGRFATNVEPKIIQKNQNRIDLVFEIDEGPKSKISEILFVGNNVFSDTRLRGIIATKEARWYRFFLGGDNYDPDRLNFDKEQLRKFYVNHGYADFQVVSITTDLTPKQDAFIVTFTVDEGQKYKFGTVGIETSFENMDKAQLMELVKSEEGETFNAKDVEHSINALVDAASDQGYAFVDVRADYDRRPEEQVVNMVYTMKEGPKVYIDRIDISGNVRTLDKVIRREFRVEEGDPYNAAQIRRSKQRIENLAFFEEVSIENEPTQFPDKINIDVDVKERSTGELTFGAGFSSADGPIGNVSIRERNLLGKGQDLRLGFERGQRGFEVNLSFTEPHFLDKDIRAGFDLFSISRDYETESSYDIETVGGTLRAAYDITEYLQHTVRYSYRSDEITDVNSAASVFVQAQEGEHDTSLVGHTLMYDRRNNRYNPTEGYYLRLNQDLAGFGGNGKFFRNEVRLGYFQPVISEEVIMKLIGRAGHVFAYGDENVRISDRFFIGGRQMRGFDTSGIGPRDSATNDSLGGKSYYTGTVEVEFPLGTPDELGLKGAIFTDVGSLWGTDDSGPTLLDESSVRLSVGVGVAWGSPLGPIRIDFAKALLKENFDETEIMRFNFGTQF